jgi:uncharacterized protein (TIGR02246 family)
MRSSRTLFPLLGLAALAACAVEGEKRTEAESPGSLATPTTADPAAVRRSIDSANARLADALTREDAAAHAANYSSDAIVMMSNMPAWKGQTDIQTKAGELFQTFDIKDPKFTTESVEISGDLAVETGAYSMTLTPKGGKAMADSGKYITVWKRQADGSWKIFRDISNSNLEMK